MFSSSNVHSSSEVRSILSFFIYLRNMETNWNRTALLRDPKKDPYVLPSKEINRILKEINQGCIDSLKVILENEIDFHWSNICHETTGDTLLHIAAKQGHKPIVQYLLCECPPIIVNCRNKLNKTPLHEALQSSHYDICTLLITMGADLNAIKGGDWTPLMLACAKVTKDDEQFRFLCYLLLKGHKTLINCQNKDGWTALHLAARVGNVEIVKKLLLSSADYNIKTKNGCTAFHIAVLHGNLEVVEKLLNYTNDLLRAKDVSGNTPLHLALLGQNLDMCRFLIQQGADITCRNNSDFNLLHLAATVDNVALVQYVLNELQFDINSVNRNGWSALHCAARKNLKAVYKFLIEHDANDTLKDNYGRQASHYLRA
ncbi:serine/threonine-protein phosphatase 6 regulatory ankyrin repeat subunit A-like [Cylas formicarius]|uniref:serine/threonine-protein phosphatase 6 regulatory ankyrin repeat subunit A-like n=1 Tax=Cylas formicarius TaxID=197179 RepID=UPI002958DB32|nr:serine/threonine-protein phosphatase 6 regulatory ankyrin repeat subunit A-like [Cylas formicarius]